MTTRGRERPRSLRDLPPLSRDSMTWTGMSLKTSHRSAMASTTWDAGRVGKGAGAGGRARGGRGGRGVGGGDSGSRLVPEEVARGDGDVDALLLELAHEGRRPDAERDAVVHALVAEADHVLGHVADLGGHVLLLEHVEQRVVQVEHADAPLRFRHGRRGGV